MELRATEPLVDMHMMRRRAVWTNNLVAFMFGIGMYSVIGFLPEFVQTPTSTGYGFGASIIQSGLFLLPLTVTMFVTGLLSGRIAAGIGSKAAVIIGSIASTGAYLLLAFAHHQAWEIYLASTLLGVGLGLAFSAMSNLIVQAVPMAQTGVASGMNANIRTIGGAIGAAVMSSIVASEILSDGYPSESDYTKGFAFLAAMTVVAVIAALFIPKVPGAGADADLPHHLEHAELAVVPGRGRRRVLTRRPGPGVRGGSGRTGHRVVARVRPYDRVQEPGDRPWDARERTWSSHDRRRSDSTETFEQGDDAIDEASRLDPDFIEELELDPSLDPTSRWTTELEEAGAELDDPEQIAILDGLIDDPDGLGGPSPRTRAARPTPRAGTSTRRSPPARSTTPARD